VGASVKTRMTVTAFDVEHLTEKNRWSEILRRGLGRTVES